jgi:hypothetical protein
MQRCLQILFALLHASRQLSFATGFLRKIEIFMSNQIVTVKLPHAGLGHMLLLWARAATFAELNQLPMLAPNWNGLHIGPWLRGERCKRFYGGYFSSAGEVSQLSFLIQNLARPKQRVYNPPVDKLQKHKSQASSVFVFDEMPPWQDYFVDVKYHQPLLKKKLLSIVQPPLLKSILKRPAPEIAIHIRRSDFKVLKPGENAMNFRSVQIELDWYIDILKSIRRFVDFDIPATIFSDGYQEELLPILNQPNVSISSETSAISDMLTMSRCKLLIASSHSGFSAWASFLGQCPTIWPELRYDLYEPIFTEDTRHRIYEGGWNPRENSLVPKLLQTNLQDLFPTLKS